MPARKRKLTQKALELETAKQGKAKRKSPNKSINVPAKKVVEIKQKKADTRSRSKTNSTEEAVVNTEPETKTRSRSAGKKAASKAANPPKTLTKDRSEPVAKIRGISAGKGTASKVSENETKQKNPPKTVVISRGKSAGKASKKVEEEIQQQNTTNDVIMPETKTRSRSSGKAAAGKPSAQPKQQQTKTKAGSKLKSSISTNIITVEKKSEEITSTAKKRNVSKKPAGSKVAKEVAKPIDKPLSKKEVNKKSEVPQKRSSRNVATTVQTPKVKKKATPPKESVNQNTTIVGAIRKRKLETSGVSVVPMKKSRRACRAQIQMPTPKPLENKSRGKKLSSTKTSKNISKNKSTTKLSLEAEMNVSEKSTSDSILQVQSDNEDAEQPKTVEPRKSLVKTPKQTAANKKRSLSSKKKPLETTNRTLETSQLNMSKNTSQIPIWKRNDIKNKHDYTGGDIYDPLAYYQDEDEEERTKPKKKKPQRRKKDTKAILAFGDKKKQVRQNVKNAHNLKTPLPAVKQIKMTSKDHSVSKNFSYLKQNFSKRGYVSNARGGPSQGYVSNARGGPSQGYVSNASLTHLSTDMSCGAQNYFDSFQDDDVMSLQVTAPSPPPPSPPPSTTSYQQHQPYDREQETTTSNTNKLSAVQSSHVTSIPKPQLETDGSNPATPTIPKTFAKRLQKDHSSTPNATKEPVASSINETTKDMIKNAFGFDTDESEDDFSCGESILSPVKKVPRISSFLEMSKPYDSRMSTMSSFREPEPIRPNIWRGDIEPRITKSRIENRRQILAMVKAKTDQGLAKLKQKHFAKPMSLSSSSFASNQSGQVRVSPRKRQQEINASSASMVSVPEMSQAEFSVFEMPPPSSASHDADDDLSVQAAESENRGVTAASKSPAKVANNQPLRQSPRKALSSMNAYDVLKSAQSGEQVKIKKLTKKMPKKQLDQSSMLEDPLAAKINRGGEVRRKLPVKNSTAPSTSGSAALKPITGSASLKPVSDKENSSSQFCEPGPSDSVRTYSVNKTKNSFNSTKSGSPSKPKVIKKKKKVDTWAAMQSTLFSEIEDFEMSFA